MFDLGPATRELSRLVTAVRDDQLGAPTPCPDYALGDLLEHVHGLALAFRMAADRETSEGSPGPSGDASRLPEDWRQAIPDRLDALAVAWGKDEAWPGTTYIAGFEAPATDVAMTAANELVVHGWDVARASGQQIEVDPASLVPCAAFADVLTGPQGDAMRGSAFGEPFPVPDDASPLDRVIAANGRDPRWVSPR